MTTYSPANLLTSSIGPHQGLRVTFAETRSIFTPDAVESSDLADNVAHLVDQMSQGGYDIAPASDVTVASGELAATVDFVVVGNGNVAVSDAVNQIQGALYGPLDILRRTYIRSVELLGAGGVTFGTPIAAPGADTETSLTSLGLGTLGIGLLVAGVVALFVFAPEVKTGVRLGARRWE